MNEHKKQVSTIAQRAAELDAIASEAALAFGSANQGAAMALQLADGIQQMRALLDTPEIKTKIIALQDTRLGFRTDRDPKTIDRKTNKPKEPYSWIVVRECALEALLRGVTLCGNQFNIIANGSYITREGYLWKLSKVKGFADLKWVPGVPKMMSGGAIVHYGATWTLNKQPGNLDMDVACKGDDYMGTDGYLGKAERKLFKRIYEIVSGKTSDPDGDVDDRPMLNAPAPAATEGFHPPKRLAHSEPEGGAKQEAQAPPAAESTAPDQPQETPIWESSEKLSDPKDNVPMDDAPKPEPTLHEKLEAKLTESGITFTGLCTWAEAVGYIRGATSLPSVSHVRESTVTWLLRNWAKVEKGVKGGAK